MYTIYIYMYIYIYIHVCVHVYTSFAWLYMYIYIDTHRTCFLARIFSLSLCSADWFFFFFILFFSRSSSPWPQVIHHHKPQPTTEKHGGQTWKFGLPIIQINSNHLIMALLIVPIFSHRFPLFWMAISSPWADAVPWHLPISSQWNICQAQGLSKGFLGQRLEKIGPPG